MTTNNDTVAPARPLTGEANDTVSEKDWPYKIPVHHKSKVVAYTLVDKEDYEYLSRYKWQYDRGYAKRTKTQNKVDRVSRMHREILGVTDPKVHVDHINNNRLDNRRNNLRICSVVENNRNSLNRSTSKVPYKGVTMTASKTNPYRATIGLPGKHIHLGCFPTPELAAIAYNKAAVEHFGEFANLNTI